jgi:hypothetical protein
VFRETFASEAACEAWGGVSQTALWSEEGHDTPGACTFCGVPNGSGTVYLRKTVTMPRAGRVSISVWLKDATVGGTPVQVGFALVGGASIMTSITATTSWAEDGGASAGVLAGAAIEVRLGVAAAAIPGQCVTFDDVFVYVD